MSRTLAVLRVFLLMCLPLPQGAYAAIQLGRGEGLHIVSMLALYAVSDLLALMLIAWLLRRVQAPKPLRSLFERVTKPASAVTRRGASLPAMFVLGLVSLYTVGVIVGLSRVRMLPALVAGVAGDLLQFAATLLAGSTLLRLVPIPGGEWTVVLVAPLLLWLGPPAVRSGRRLAMSVVRPAAMS